MNEHRSRPVAAVLAATVKAERTKLVALAAWAAVEAVPAYLSGRLVAHAVDRGFLAGRPGNGLAWLAFYAATVFIGAWGTRQTYRRLASLVEPFRDELVVLAVRGALRRSTRPGAAPDTGAVARLTQHVEVAREAFGNLLMVVQGFVVTTVSALLGLFGLIPAALLLVVPPLLVAVTLFAVLVRFMATSRRDSILADEHIAEEMATVAAGLRDIAACGGEGAVERSLHRHIEAQAAATRSLARITAWGSAVEAVGGWLPMFAVLVGAAWLQRHGATTGALLGVATYVLDGVQPALQTLVRQLGGMGAWLTVAVSRIVGTEDAAIDSGPAKGAGAAAPDCLDLAAHRVTFRYGPWAQPVLWEFDLEVPEGDHIAIVGPSGVGKSTLAGVLAGVLRPEAGTVTYGGVDVGDLDPAVLAQMRVLIPQEAYVFSGTLRANLLYLHRDAPPEALDAAVALLGAGDLVARLGGYDAVVDPSSLSAGERQLVSLVRAWLSPAHVAVLDEGTCHLDALTEDRIERAFAGRSGTLIVVAHRISSALRARRVLVMDGRRVALGTHEDLLATSDLYKDLVGSWVDLAPGDSDQEHVATR